MDKRLLFSVTLKDCTVQTFRSGGKGGQHQNKTESGVRIIHRDSGARGECRETKSQHKNKRTAFIRMTETQEFKLWMNRMSLHFNKDYYSPEDKVQKMLENDAIRVDVKVDGKWEESEMINCDSVAANGN